jgi:hypothetical protein
VLVVPPVFLAVVSLSSAFQVRAWEPVPVGQVLVAVPDGRQVVLPAASYW